MMHSECVNCPKLGISCIPNFAAMTVAELVNWCKLRKTYLGLSNTRIAELANMSKGTVDGLFASSHSDFRYETIRPVLKVLVGGDWSGDACPEPTADERAKYEALIHEQQEKMKALEDAVQWRDDKIQHLTRNNDSMQTLITNTNARHTKDKDFLSEQIRSKNKTIAILSTFLGLALLVIIAALVIDRLNGDMGFFWLDSMLHRSVENGTQLNGCLPNRITT